MAYESNAFGGKTWSDTRGGYLPPEQVWNRHLAQAGVQNDKLNYWSKANEVNAHNYNLPAKPGPSDWSEFRQNFGGGFAKESDYNNWRLGQQRERTLGDFVNRMSASDPATAQFSAKMGGDYDKYKGNLDAHLAQRGPQMDTSNRFEAGLSANEGRLSALLTDPNSIQNTAAYKFRVNQGLDALNRQLGARGLLNSGNRLAETTKYGQDMASQEYDNQFGRLRDLVQSYSQNWLGDKNANTARYSAESNAWNQRGNLLKDIYGQAQQGVTNAAKIGADQRIGWANAWTNQAPKAQQWALGST